MNQKIIRIALLIFIAILGYAYNRHQGVSPPGQPTTVERLADATLLQAFENKRSDIQVQGEGIVVRNLPDDREGSRHQKFILKTHSGVSLLVAHNIDLAPRVSGLKEGDRVEFFGEYEWNPKGGVIHWTHHDPKNYHVGGWLKHQGRIYQ